MAGLAPYFGGDPLGPMNDYPVTPSALVGEAKPDAVVEQPLRLATSRPFDNLVGVMNRDRSDSTNMGGMDGLNNFMQNGHMMQPAPGQGMGGIGAMGPGGDPSFNTYSPSYYSPTGNFILQCVNFVEIFV